MSSLIKNERETGKSLCLEPSADDVGERLDRYLAYSLVDLSRSSIKKLIEDGSVLVDGQRVKMSHKLKGGERIVVRLPPARTTEILPEDIPLSIVFEDECLLVLNKPAGLVVHPAAGHAGGTLVNAILHHDPKIAETGGADRPGIVHRLDKGTSGVMVIAKTEAARLSLVQQFKDREIYKEYWALVHGVLSPMEGSFESPLGRHPQHRKKFTMVPSGRPAKTEYRVLENYAGLLCGVRLILHTGRTHQIRVHLSEAGHPIVGDKEYGGRRDMKRSLPQELRDAIRDLGRPALHAQVLGLRHPVTGEEMRFEAPLAGELKDLLRLLNAI